MMRDPDVVIVGAGAAGIAAARAVREAGRSCIVLEARRRVGGRAVTTRLGGHPVDLGPHWLHFGHDNPLLRLALRRGEPVHPAPDMTNVFIGRRQATTAECAASCRAWADPEAQMTALARRGGDVPVSDALRPLGPWFDRGVFIHGLVSGRPLREVSVLDYAAAKNEDSRNWFIRGGYGAYLARLAAGLPVRLGATVSAIALEGAGVRVTLADGGEHRARACIITVPPPVLAAGGIRFEPALPLPARDALGAFLPAGYEHMILNWPGSPFAGRDRLCAFAEGADDSIAMLTNIAGGPFHYFELDHDTAARLRAGGAAFARSFAVRTLAGRFGWRAVRGLRTVGITDWWRDPLSLGSWSVVPPGRHGVRQALHAPIEDRLWFAGEATAPEQWGTAGGAWGEGERAAAAALARLP